MRCRSCSRAITANPRALSSLELWTTLSIQREAYAHGTITVQLVPSNYKLATCHHWNTCNSAIQHIPWTKAKSILKSTKYEIIKFHLNFNISTHHHELHLGATHNERTQKTPAFLHPLSFFLMWLTSTPLCGRPHLALDTDRCQVPSKYAAHWSHHHNMQLKAKTKLTESSCKQPHPGIQT